MKLVILALVGLTMGQAVVWYTGQFHALFFLERMVKVDAATANILIAIALIIGTPFFIFFRSLSDRIGRKPIIMAGCLIAALTYFPPFKELVQYGNPDLEAALAKTPITVVADPAKMNKPMLVLLLTIMVLYVTMVYEPIAAMLAEPFSTRIRYTSMSLPYHIGNGWFGGFLPATSFAIVASRGNIYSGLWYPIIFALITFVVGMLFVRETKDVDIYAKD